jgi:hypothetical protein
VLERWLVVLFQITPLGDFISSTKIRTWRHSLIWFADELKDAALAVDARSPTQHQCVERGEKEEATKRALMEGEQREH